MKKKMSFICGMLLLPLLLAGVLSLEVKAETPYITFTSGPNDSLVDTLTAYTPENVIQLGLNSPEDLYIDDNNDMYICDTGNSRIVIVKADGSIQEIKGESLSQPTGIHVTEDHIYVVDYANQEICIYGKDLELQTKIGKPTEAIFGKSTKFLPRKLLTDERGNIYVVSEGSTAGLMQFNPAGKFLGYFGANTSTTTLKLILQRTFFTEEQLNQLFKITPASITNIGIDSQGLIYTVTNSNTDHPVKKLNISGSDLFPSDMITGSGYVDVDVDSYGNTYAVTSDGYIYEYDSYGELLFMFGGKDNDKERMGVLGDPQAIAVTNDERIFILDKGKNCILEYKATEFTKLVHQGIAMYRDGKYEESEELWQNIKKMNSSFTLAYAALAKADYKKQDYDSALYHYKLAEDKTGYSQTYWVMRNNWIKDNLVMTIWIIILLFILWKLLKILDKRKHLFAPVRTVWKRVVKILLVMQLSFMKKMLKKPMDGYYQLKFQRKVSICSATILYIWLIVLQLTGTYSINYLFRMGNTNETGLLNKALWVIGPAALWIICNYMVSTITEGEGRVRDIYCGTIYALSPYLIFALPLQLLTHLLTNNEAFIYSFGMVAVIVWSAVLFCMMVKEIHSYSFSGMLKNIGVTIFTIALFLLFGFILYLLFEQLRNFIITIIQEAKIR